MNMFVRMIQLKYLNLSMRNNQSTFCCHIVTISSQFPVIPSLTTLSAV